jgi:hypothetical protein
MINREKIDDLFRFLLAGVSAPADDRQVRVDQSRQLLSAFNRIDDSQLRQELLVLIEIVSNMPELLQQKREGWIATQPAQIH